MYLYILQTYRYIYSSSTQSRNFQCKGRVWWATKRREGDSRKKQKRSFKRQEKRDVGCTDIMEALREDFLWNLNLLYSRNKNFLQSVYENLFGNGFIFELWTDSVFHLLHLSPTFI